MSKITKLLHKQAYEKIKNSKHILLATHEKPDGDALSSIGVMIELLEKLNKIYTAFCIDEPPIQFDFLSHVEKIKTNKNKIDISQYDLFISLDCGSLSRTGLHKEINNSSQKPFIIEFDHHLKIEDIADIEIRDSAAASTTEVLYDFLQFNKIPINKNIANCILTGILTDTAFFLYPSTRDKTISIASEMLEKGARFSKIIENTWRNKSLGAMQIWGKALANIYLNKKYGLAFSVLTKKDVEQSQTTEEELEGIAGFMSNLEGVRAILLLKEEPDGKIKGSLRTSRSDVDVSLLARALGGGGHKKASGFKFKGRLIKGKNGWEVVDN